MLAQWKCVDILIYLRGKIMQSENPMQAKRGGQGRYLQRYLSLIPVIAVLAISVAFSTWVLFNAAFPDLLFHPMP